MLVVTVGTGASSKRRRTLSQPLPPLPSSHRATSELEPAAGAAVVELAVVGAGVAQLDHDAGEGLVVVAGEVAGPVVRGEDAQRRLVVHVEPVHGDLGGALAGERGDAPVAGEDAVGGPLHDDGAPPAQLAQRV